MRRTIALILVALTLPLRGCSYSYPVIAKVIRGHLAFVSGDPKYDCVSMIKVSPARPVPITPEIAAMTDPSARSAAIERQNAMWLIDVVPSECTARFPVFYGAPQLGVPPIVPPKKLQIGVAYYVFTDGPDATGGSGCFRITRDRRIENDLSLCSAEISGEAPPTDAANAIDATGAAPTR
jgi:hypothetical protein